jgi:hypothetical protein
MAVYGCFKFLMWLLKKKGNMKAINGRKGHRALLLGKDYSGEAAGCQG